MTRRRLLACARRGSGLVEIMIALVIFALVATSQAALTLRLATRIKSVGTGAERSAALMEYMNRLYALPYDSLAARAGCVTTTRGSLPNTRCITVTTSGTTSTVRLVLTPTNTALKPDTITLTRRRQSVSPLS
ncbi:MAG: prepilin-type N-terminal cleavage/methylation domain-containing protein [Gemmatimonadaceae bacterium]|nr:prepilin-type N-terminal cleavage/methylation domain-containing protein [Gemmatimonadaceae bacterium]